MQQSEQLIRASPRASPVVPLLHIGFVLIGIVNTLLGPILPLLSARWRLDDAGAGALFFVQSAGAIVGSALCGLLIKRFGFLPLLVAGFGLMAVSTACLGFESWVAGVLSISGTGLSLGLTIPTINLLISELNIGRRAAALNLLNLAWGVGAVSGPVLVPTLSRSVGFTIALVCVATPLIVIGILIGRSSVLLPFALTAGEATRSGVLRLWMTPYALLTAALVFVNIGTESATGGWIASYVQRLGPSSQFSWSVAPSLFWAGLLMGRAAAPFVLRRIRDTRMVLLGMFVAVSGLVIILLGTTITTVLIGVGVTGLGLAPVFPTTIALFTERFGHDATRLTGTLFILAGLGAAVFPWLVGLSSNHYGALRAGLVVPLIGGSAMIVLHAAIMATLPSRR
ncbi:MAG: MFS transporter [Acidobacteriota bacterium]|nr:MFS transporter [Acidobacteriota bacterium]